VKQVLVAVDSPRAARLGLSVAADLYWGCGARVSMAYAPPRGPEAPPAGIDAIGMLSDTLFHARDGSRCVATFQPVETAAASEPLGDVLRDSPVPLDDYWAAPAGNRLQQLCAHVERSGANLVLAAGGELLREGLLGRASVPVWLLKDLDQRRHWFPLRRVLCAARNPRAVELSKDIAAQMGAELEIGSVRALLRGESKADMAVIARGLPFQLLRLLSAADRRPLIVV
jgi:hypothetical protein